MQIRSVSHVTSPVPHATPIVQPAVHPVLRDMSWSQLLMPVKMSTPSRPTTTSFLMSIVPIRSSPPPVASILSVAPYVCKDIRWLKADVLLVLWAVRFVTQLCWPVALNVPQGICSVLTTLVSCQLVVRLNVLRVLMLGVEAAYQAISSTRIRSARKNVFCLVLLVHLLMPLFAYRVLRVTVCQEFHAWPIPHALWVRHVWSVP